MRKLCVAGMTGAIVLAALAPAAAHSRFTSSTPRKDAMLAKAPRTIELDYSEPPTGDAAVTVKDGCGDNIVSDVSVSNTTVTASLAEGQAGSWRVRFGVVSAVDGHPTRGGFDFTVDGARDCPRAGGPRKGPAEDSGFVLLLAASGLLLLLAMLGAAYLSSRKKASE